MKSNATMKCLSCDWVIRQWESMLSDWTHSQYEWLVLQPACNSWCITELYAKIQKCFGLECGLKYNFCMCNVNDKIQYVLSGKVKGNIWLKWLTSRDMLIYNWMIHNLQLVISHISTHYSRLVLYQRWILESDLCISPSIHLCPIIAQ